MEERKEKGGEKKIPNQSKQAGKREKEKHLRTNYLRVDRRSKKKNLIIIREREEGGEEKQKVTTFP